MKIYTVLLAFLLSAAILSGSQDTTYPTANIVINSDTLFYNWEIKKYDNDIFFRTPKYNGQIWITNMDGNVFISKDNLQSWQKTSIFGNFYNKFQDICLLPNNNIILSTNKSDENYMGILFESTDNGISWVEKKHEIFNKKSIGAIKFKDNLNGVLAVSGDLTIRNVYRTEDGGKEWKKLDNISNMLEFAKDTLIISRIEYFKKSDLLKCIIYNYSQKKEYFIFSKDFGDSWTEMRSFPEQNLSPYDLTSRFGFYSTGDSFWVAGAAGTGNGQDETREYIYFSPDLGKTWQVQYSNIGLKLGDTFNSIEFFDNSKIGLACESSPRVMITFDGGAHWTWIKDPITKNGERSKKDSINAYYDKYKLVKSNNQMIFFGRGKIFKFNHHNLPATGVDYETNSDFSAFYNQSSEAIEIKSNSDEIINSITLYDITGKLLYSKNVQSAGQIYISKDKINHSKVVFALIQTNGQTFIKQIICG